MMELITLLIGAAVSGGYVAFRLKGERSWSDVGRILAMRKPAIQGGGGSGSPK